MGVAGELGTIYYARPDILAYQGTDPFLRFLNFNLSIGFSFVVLVYGFGLSFLYNHMLMQRGSALRGKKAAGAGKKKQ